MKIKQLIMLIFVFFVVAPVTNVIAVSDNSQQDTGQNTVIGNEKSTSNHGVSGAIRNCEKVEAKVQTKLQNYVANKEKHLIVYTNLLNRLDKFVTAAKAKGYDTTILEADMVVLRQKIEEFKTQAADSYALLLRTQTYTCGQAQGEFVKVLAQARQKLRLTHQKAAEIRTFYREVIRVDLQGLKQQGPGSISDSRTNQEAEG